MDNLTVEGIGRLLLYVAPGYLAVRAYQYRYPRKRREAFETLVVSLVWSVPLVALVEPARRWLGIVRNPLSWRYVALLLCVSALLGYLAAVVRGRPRVRGFLLWLGSGADPESSVLVRAASNLARTESLVTVTLRDGEVLSGCPRWWTDDPDSDVRELFLTHTAWWEKGAEGQEGGWTERREQGGVLVNLGDVEAVEFEDDPR